MMPFFEVLFLLALAGLGGWLVWREIKRVRRKQYLDYLWRKRPGKARRL